MIELVPLSTSVPEGKGNGQNESERVSTAVLQFPNV